MKIFGNLGWGKQQIGGEEKKREGEAVLNLHGTRRFHIAQKNPWTLLTVLVCDKQQTSN